MNEKPIALDAYEQLADRYAAGIDTKPHNAYYERPATLALLPDVNGWRVLDAGCGPGWYAAWLLDHGAEVVGVDASPRMIELARERTQGRADLHLADMGQPLDFLPDASFDLVLSTLAVHYVKDLAALFTELARVLRPEGLFVFSTAHPFGDYAYFKLENYFAVQAVGAHWSGFGDEPVYVPGYFHPLGAVCEGLWRAGFVIERLVEPLPTEEFKRADPKHYEELMKLPAFMCFRARKVS
jgi:SAM-dependent methyltransferase